MTSDSENHAAAPAQRRRGRPSKASTEAGATRQDIIDAAGREFAREGYDATSMRAIAREAGVDPALVRHYFADKAELFATAIAGPMQPELAAQQALLGAPDKIGEYLVRYLITVLDEPESGTRLVRMLHASLGQEFAASMLRHSLMREIMRKVATELGDADAEQRAAFAASQVVGLVVARYGIKVEPLVSLDVEEIVKRIGPVVQWHLMGNPLP